MPPGAGLYYIYICRNGSVRPQSLPAESRSCVGMARETAAMPPAVKRSFTSMKMVHTHTPCRSRVGEMEFKIRWQWKLYENQPSQNTRRGTQKEKKREETPTPTHPAQNGRSLKRAGEKKKRTDDGPNTDQRRGGGQRRLTQPTRREPNLPRHAQDPNLTQHGITHEIGGQWGTS